MIKKRNYEKEDSMLKFHCMQIELITKCSLGKIYEVRRRALLRRSAVCVMCALLSTNSHLLM